MYGSDRIGIPIPSSNQIVRSLLQNYAPTAIATIIEPIWVVLSRLLCLLKPFEVLRQGNASTSKSLGLRYNAIPPQLAIWRAFQARHLLLGIVCIITVSTNVLTVTLAGLFNEGGTTQVFATLAKQSLMPQLAWNYSGAAYDPGRAPSLGERVRYHIPLLLMF